MPQPVRVVLNTRHGALRRPGDFSSCKWFLPDPVFAPDASHRLFVDVTFTAIPGDHRRLTRARGTTRLLMESREGLNGPIQRHEAEVEDGSYTREGYLRAIGRAMCTAVHRDLEGGDVRMPTDYKPVQFVRAKNSELHEHETQEIMLIGIPFADRSFRVVHDNEHLAAEVLGFHETSHWARSLDNVKAHSTMDTQGTRTVTICATELAGNHPDPVRMERRHNVLRVLPMLGTEKHTPVVWHRPACKDGHPIGTRCPDCYRARAA